MAGALEVVELGVAGFLDAGVAAIGVASGGGEDSLVGEGAAPFLVEAVGGSGAGEGDSDLGINGHCCTQTGCNVVARGPPPWRYYHYCHFTGLRWYHFFLVEHKRHCAKLEARSPSFLDLRRCSLSIPQPRVYLHCHFF